MKLSELKKQIKELHLQQEASDEDIARQKKFNAELEKTKELVSNMGDKTVTKKQFEAFLREEILETLNEEEDAPEEENVELGDLEGEEDITSTIEEPAQDKALELDDIGDTLVKLARRAKDTDERELANQILNSAKFAKKTEFKKVEKDAGIGDEQV